MPLMQLSQNDNEEHLLHIVSMASKLIKITNIILFYNFNYNKSFLSFDKKPVEVTGDFYVKGVTIGNEYEEEIEREKEGIRKAEEDMKNAMVVKNVEVEEEEEITI